MNGLLEIVYPVNNDKLSIGSVRKGEFLGIKDADGNVILSIHRCSFDGKNYAERRERALSFARALVSLMNSHMERTGIV